MDGWALRWVAPEARSALAVLRGLAGLLEAVLLPLRGARVTGQEAGLLEGRAVIGVDLDERTGDRETQRARLARNAATVQVGEDVERIRLLDQDQRVLDELLVHLVREVLLEGAAVELELTGARHDAHADDGFLAAADRLGVAAGGPRGARRGGALAGGDGAGLGHLGGGSLSGRRLGRRSLGNGRLGRFDDLGGLGLGAGHRLFLTHCATCAILVISRACGCCAACGCCGPAYTFSFFA